MHQDKISIIVDAPYTFDNNLGLNYAVLAHRAGPFDNNLVGADAVVVEPAVWQMDKVDN